MAGGPVCQPYAGVKDLQRYAIEVLYSAVSLQLYLNSVVKILELGSIVIALASVRQF